MSSFFHYFASRNLLAYLITLIIILLGVSTLVSIKRDSFPEVDFGEVLITTNYPGASPEDVELKVTNKLEKELKEVVGISEYKSWSMENVSLIHIQIDPDEDDDEKVIRDIREAVTRVSDLPVEVSESPQVTEVGTSLFPMIEVGLSGKLSYAGLREIARRFEKKLEAVGGVAKVERFGYQAREISVEVSPGKLKQFDVPLNSIVSAIKRRNVQSTGGSFESYTSEKNIVTLAQFRNPQEVGDVIVKATFKSPLVKISDLAIVRDGFEDANVLSRVNGIAAVSFVAYKKSAADIIRTVDSIKSLVDSEKAFLPDGVTIQVSNDSSQYVSKRFQIVVTNGLMGLALVMLVLTLALNLRVAFWVALGVPIAILGVIFMLPIFDTYLDSITMTAMVLVLGIIVDDAIIISEQIYQKSEQGLGPVDAAVQGVTEVFKPVLTTIFTTFVAFAPLFFMPGMLGKFVYVIPLVITLALVVSLVESTLALPAHLTGGLGRNGTGGGGSFKQKLFEQARIRYRLFVIKILRFRYLLVAAFILLLAGTVTFAVKTMDFVLFPSSTADKLVVLIQTPVGTSLEATSEKTRQVEQIVSALDKTELDSYVTRIGTFGDIGSSENENHAALWVSLTPFATRKRTADDIVEALREKTDKLKGFQRIFYIIDAGGPPVGRPILIRAVGSDDELRNKLATDVYNYLKTLPGTKDLDRDDKPGKQQVEIILDYEKLARVGITVADVAQNVRIAYDGEVVTNVRYGDEDVDFRVIFDPDVRKSPEYLRQLVLPNKGGYLTPLGDLAHFRTGPGPSRFQHFKGERAISVTGDVDRNVTTPLKISRAVHGHFNLYKDYPGMRLIIGGEAEKSEKSFDDLLSILVVAAIGIYFLLVLLFNSIWQPILVMLALPFGVIGVIVGFAVNNEVLGFLAMTGIIGLAGVVVNDSLVLVNHINELRKREPQLSLQELVALGTSNRLRAILLTTISTVAGLLPLAYGIGGSDPYMGPMALALSWGLLFATPLTLVLLPCLYLIGQDIALLFSRRKAPAD